MSQLPRNSVGPQQLKANAVTSGKIRDGSVESKDLAQGAGGRGPRGATGPVGPSGSSGPPGPTGPSETIQVKRIGVTQIPPSANGNATVGSATIGAGSWLLDAQVKLDLTGTGGSEYFDCDLRTAAGELLIRSTARIGEGPSAALSATMPVHVAASFATPTQVSLICSHVTAIAGSPVATQAVLTATRIGTLENR